MTKKEIIRAISFATVPEGATLVKRDTPDGGFSAAIDLGGMKIMAAEVFQEVLTVRTMDLDEEPSPVLFERLHRTALEFYCDVIESTVVEAVQTETVVEYSLIIERLTKLASDMSIKYDKPKDELFGWQG